MTEFVQAVYGGIASGSVYALMALGLTLIWGAMRLLNLAHGALYLVGAYAGWTVLNTLGLPLAVAIPLSVAGAAAAGLLMYGLFIRPMLGRSGWDSASLIATAGMAIAAQAAALLVFGPQFKEIPNVLNGAFKVSRVVITNQALLVIAVAAVSLVAMSAWLRASRGGMAIRAVSQDMQAAGLMGINIDGAFRTVIMLSAGLAGLAGILLSSIFYLAPTSGFTPMIQGVVVTIFGGLGSVKGTVVAAYTIGLLEAFLEVYLGASWALPGAFLLIIVVLIVRPSGLFGLAEGQRL
jgi:branched-chain amino acid transport system permease protein